MTILNFMRHHISFNLLRFPQFLGRPLFSSVESSKEGTWRYYLEDGENNDFQFSLFPSKSKSGSNSSWWLQGPMTELQPLQYLDLKHVPGLLAAPGHTSHSLCRPLHLCQRCQVDSTAFSIFVDILVELRVIVNKTNISTIETVVLSRFNNLQLVIWDQRNLQILSLALKANS